MKIGAANWLFSWKTITELLKFVANNENVISIDAGCFERSYQEACPGKRLRFMWCSDIEAMTLNRRLSHYRRHPDTSQPPRWFCRQWSIWPEEYARRFRAVLTQRKPDCKREAAFSQCHGRGDYEISPAPHTVRWTMTHIDARYQKETGFRHPTGCRQLQRFEKFVINVGPLKMELFVKINFEIMQDPSVVTKKTNLAVYINLRIWWSLLTWQCTGRYITSWNPKWVKTTDPSSGPKISLMQGGKENWSLFLLH